MATRPQSWMANYDEPEFDVPMESMAPSGRDSPGEQQIMLSNMAASPTRLSTGSDALSPGASRPANHPLCYPHSPAIPGDLSPQLEPLTHETGLSSFRMSGTGSSKSVPFLSSPLNPAHQNGAQVPNPSSPFTRPSSRGSSFLARIPSEESRALAGSANGNRRSFMILYRPAGPDEVLLPPHFPSHSKRPVSISAESYLSLSSDSKYPIGLVSEHGLVAYAYDPSLDEREPMDEEDMLHNPDVKTIKVYGPISWRGFKNFAMLGALIAAALCLFVLYPVYSFYNDNGRNALIVGNTRINSTGQAEFLSIDARSQLPMLTSIEGIDPFTPEDVRKRTTARGDEYTLIFSDEFETAGRIFSADTEEFWTAIDDEFYQAQQVTTRDGNLVIHLAEISVEDGSWSQQISGMLRQRSPFCLAGGGYVDMHVTLPHTGSPLRLFWSRHWSMSAGGDAMPDGGGSLSQSLALSMDIGLPLNFVQLPPDPAPAPLLIDYIRVYRRAGELASSCDDLSIPTTTLSFP